MPIAAPAEPVMITAAVVSEGRRPALAALPSRARPALRPQERLARGRWLSARLASCDDRAALIALTLRALHEEFGATAALLLIDGVATTVDGRRAEPALQALAARCVKRGELQRPAQDDAQRGALAVPLQVRGRVQGALALGLSDGDAEAGYDEREDALVLLATQCAALLAVLGGRTVAPVVPAARVRRHAADDSVFVDGDYLIRGVAGGLLWKLLSDHLHSGRRSFTSKELRVDPALRLPEGVDNLDARLILLRRRLAEHGRLARIERTGRGRFEFSLLRPVLLDAA